VYEALQAVKVGADTLARHWFAVAQSESLRANPQRVLLFGTALVLLRGPDGTPWVFEDRCPHRGAALSRGRLGSNGLACPYHGWSFDREGRCTAIPGAPESPTCGIRLKTYTALERDGLLWVSDHCERPLPDRIVALDPSKRRFLWQARWQANVLDVQENFLDALHTHTTHAGLVRGASPRKPVKTTLITAGDGFHVDYEGQPGQSGLLYKLFESPRSRERAYFSGASVGQLEYRYASGRVVWITLCFTPESAGSTHLFGQLHVESGWAPTWLIRVLVWPLLRHVAHQDQVMVEHIEAQRLLFPGRRALILPSDLARPYLLRAWQGSSDPLPDQVTQTLEL
jgi:phenylpropionate dioxygenase-like ring-hydroxylating dioxygenase large terminal subunit